MSNIEPENPERTEEPMGRPPIHDTPMTPAERQRRRRERLRRQPWNDPRLLAWAVVRAVRGLRDEDDGPLDAATVAALIDRAAEELGVEAEHAEEAVAALGRFLDPAEPLPERGGRHRRGGRGHRFGDRHRARRARRGKNEA